jgi:hypothetical protein
MPTAACAINKGNRFFISLFIITPPAKAIRRLEWHTLF